MKIRLLWMLVAVLAALTVTSVTFAVSERTDCGHYQRDKNALTQLAKDDERTGNVNTVADQRTLYHYIINSPCSTPVEKARAQAFLDSIR